MARDDGVKIGAGGAIIQEIAHEKAPVTNKPKVKILEETVRDSLPSDIESAGEDEASDEE